MKKVINLEGLLRDEKPDEHGYVHYRLPDIDIRYHETYEPDGEVVAKQLAYFHLEQMGKRHWWLRIENKKGNGVAINLHSKRRIKIRYDSD